MNSADAPIAITLGCPAGIGPEIIVEAFALNPEWLEPGKVLVYGDKTVLSRAMKVVGKEFPVVPPGSPHEGIHLKAVTDLDIADVPPGMPTTITGRASYDYVVRAVKDAINGRVCAVVTAPISKDGLRKAGISFPGHTELLSDLTGARDYLMMLMGKRLRVVLVTIHIPLKEVPYAIDREKIKKTLIITDMALKRDFGIECPRIAVAGLNPHAGENGLFGDEEKRIITPAIMEARGLGIHCTGPYPPDTIFYRALNREFDVVCAQYHDQGLIPLKLIHFDDGVNVTLNLPIVRTSVDHGTAYDIAGKGLASPRSLMAAVETAREMVKWRTKTSS